MQQVRLKLLLVVTSICLVLTSVGESAQAEANPIVLENQHAGTGAWQTWLPGYAYSDDGIGQIAGYADQTSLNKGETLTLHVSVNPTQTFAVDIYRYGWYGGWGGRLMQHEEELAGVQQPGCNSDTQTGSYACQWTPSYSLTVPMTWTTGLYLAMLTNAQHFQYRVFFVLRDDQRSADFLFQHPVLTFQAYNNWPAGTEAGKSLYEANSSTRVVAATGTGRAAKVSLDRPGDSNSYPHDHLGELNLLRWLEHEGYDVSYISDIDTHLDGARLLRYKAFISAGHNEYWTQAMFDHVEAARDAGVHLAFFGANAAYWQVRLEASGSGTPNRVLVCYKYAADPIADQRAQTKRFREIGRPEQTLIGVMYSNDNVPFHNAPFIPQNIDHWAYATTGISSSLPISNLVGYEIDRFFPTYTAPLSTSYTLLGNSPFDGLQSVEDYSQASLYQAPSGAWVFATGSMSWSWGLDRPDTENEGIKQLTRNILNRFLRPPDLPPTATPLPTQTTTVTPTRTNTPIPAPPTITTTLTPPTPRIFLPIVLISLHAKELPTLTLLIHGVHTHPETRSANQR